MAWDNRGKAEGSKDTLTRKEAKKRGFTTYYNGNLCKYGHKSERRVSNGDCLDCAKERDALWAKENSDKKWQREKKRRADNLEFHRKYRRDYAKDRYHKDTEYKAVCILRNFITRLKRSGLNTNNSLSKQEIGYSAKDFVDHVESTWKKGMSWQNHGEWHIDHIKPIKAFLNEGITDPSIVNSLENLEPIWAEDNLKKSSTYNVMG